MGITLMAMKGYKVNLMTSNVINDPRVSRHVEKFYEKKYAAMEKYFNGGKTMHVEDKLRFFYQALENNEIVFILADLPSSTTKTTPDIIAPFMDGTYHMAPGPFRLALKTKSRMAAFYCLNQGFGKYHVHCSDTYSSDNLDDTVEHLYDFLQQPIKKYPQRWHAAELLNTYLSK
jgi:lauroyl/myristoyl acyltransferase